MGKVSFKDDPTEASQILIEQDVLAGSSGGLAWDQLGGYEFVTDSILFPETDVLSYLLLEDGSGGIELEDGTGYILIDEESELLFLHDIIVLEDGFGCILMEDGSGHIYMEVDTAG